MPLEREMLPDRPETREKYLCAFGVAKATHAPLAFACRLVAVLCAVVQPRCRFDEHVLHVRKRQDVEFGAMLVDRTPQQVQFASQRDKHISSRCHVLPGLRRAALTR